MKSDSNLLRWFRRFNRRFFKSRLEEPIVCYESAPESKRLGRLLRPQFIRYRVTGKKWVKFDSDRPIILISSNLQGEDKVALRLQTLLHEMVHLKLPIRIKHGQKFRNEVARLVKMGAYDGLF